jgi:hypothetical protein
VHRVTEGQHFCEYFGFALPVTFPPLLPTRLTSGAGSMGRSTEGLSPTSPPKINYLRTKQRICLAVQPGRANCPDHSLLPVPCPTVFVQMKIIRERCLVMMIHIITHANLFRSLLLSQKLTRGVSGHRVPRKHRHDGVRVIQ